MPGSHEACCPCTQRLRGKVAQGDYGPGPGWVPRPSGLARACSSHALPPVGWVQEDWLGLKRLDAKGGLVFGDIPGEHMQFSMKWFRWAVGSAGAGAGCATCGLDMQVR